MAEMHQKRLVGVLVLDAATGWFGSHLQQSRAGGRRWHRPGLVRREHITHRLPPFIVASGLFPANTTACRSSSAVMVTNASPPRFRISLLPYLPSTKLVNLIILLFQEVAQFGFLDGVQL